MKKILAGILLTLILLIPSLTVSAANIQIKIDGVAIASDVAPEIKNNRTMIPIRVISENLGATVEWSNPIVTVTKNEIEIKLNINDGSTTKNGKSVLLDSKPYAKNNRTMVPLRFIAEAFGCEVNYQNGVVTIVTEPLKIRDQVVKGLQQENRNIASSTVFELKANSYIKDIYQIYLANKGDEVEAPLYSRYGYDVSTPGTYVQTMHHDFVDQNNKVLQGFEIAWLYNSKYEPFPAELLEGLPEYLLYDVTNNQWYIFNENAAKSIEQILQKAQNNNLLEVIRSSL